MKGDDKRIIIRQNAAKKEVVVYGDRFDRSSLTPHEDKAFMENVRDHVWSMKWPEKFQPVSL